MRRTHSRDAPRHDLAALRHETGEHPHIFVIDIVDFLDAKAANFFPPKILFLLSGDCFVAAGGTLPRAAWSSSGFRHISPVYSTGAGSPSICWATEGCAGAGAAVALRCARLSRLRLRFSRRFKVSSMRTVRNLMTRSDTRSRRSNSLTASGAAVNWNNMYAPS